MVITTHMADKIRESKIKLPELDTDMLNKIADRLEKSGLVIES